MMQIHEISGFRIPAMVGASYESMIEGLRTDRLGPALRQAVGDHTDGARRLYLYEAKGRSDSRLRFHSCEPGVAALFPVYQQRYQHLDPVGAAYRAASRAGDMAMQRVRPSDVSSIEFRRRFFDDCGIVERVSIVQRGPTEWRALNLARHRL